MNELPAPTLKESVAIGLGWSLYLILFWMPILFIAFDTDGHTILHYWFDYE
tara:strand:- start:2586 stop:2738 length:153 start_codon:yes stop_codon:yes gene_type:complete